MDGTSTAPAASASTEPLTELELDAWRGLLAVHSATLARLDTELEREQAKKNLERKQAFRTQIVMYVLVNALLVVIWAVTDAGFFWPIFPIVGWGIGLGAQAYGIYGQKQISEADIDQEVEKLR